MRKNDLIKAAAKTAGLTQEQGSAMLDAVLQEIGSALEKGEKVELFGFGSFSISERAARTGRNPQTGKSMKIPASKGVRFKVSKGLKDRVNT
ncbi:MAG: HU family DNA-binding protein [Magnetococcales bacterium]|nr:HU family DNA-binding protein [Magnetococcales bacterium]